MPRGSRHDSRPTISGRSGATVSSRSPSDMSNTSTSASLRSASYRRAVRCCEPNVSAHGDVGVTRRMREADAASVKLLATSRRAQALRASCCLLRRSRSSRPPVASIPRRMGHPRLLVILGMNLTALAVARSAHRWGIEPWVVDVDSGPAASSRVVRSVVEPSRSRASLLQEIISQLGDRRAWLVSTSDAWNHELIANRERVDAAFARVLQPSNDALATCLSKTSFASWCEAHGVPAPRQYRFDVATSQVIGDVAFPVF